MILLKQKEGDGSTHSTSSGQAALTTGTVQKEEVRKPVETSAVVEKPVEKSEVVVKSEEKSEEGAGK